MSILFTYGFKGVDLFQLWHAEHMNFLRRKSFDPIAERLVAAGLSTDAAHLLSRNGTAVTVQAGVPLCTEGQYGREAFVLVSGGAVVTSQDEQLRTVGAGEVIGEIAALDSRRTRTATVETTQTSVVLAYDVSTFRVLAERFSDVLAPNRAA